MTWPTNTVWRSLQALGRAVLQGVAPHQAKRLAGFAAAVSGAQAPIYAFLFHRPFSAAVLSLVAAMSLPFAPGLAGATRRSSAIYLFSLGLLACPAMSAAALGEGRGLFEVLQPLPLAVLASFAGLRTSRRGDVA